jgi:hypothetical protein
VGIEQATSASLIRRLGYFTCRYGDLKPRFRDPTQAGAFALWRRITHANVEGQSSKTM